MNAQTKPKKHVAKRICFISFYAYPLFNNNCKATFGGAEVQLYQYALELARFGYSVSFIVSDFGQPNVETIDGVKVIKAFNIFNKKLKYILGIYYQLQFLLKLITSNSDIYIQRAAGVETGVIALYCKLFKKKFIYMTASSIDTDRTFRRLKPLMGIFYELGLKHASIIVSQNLDQKNNLKKNYIRNSIIIKNSFHLPSKISEQKNSILWVGSSQDLKQPQIFLDLAISLPQFKFTIVMPKNNSTLWESIYKNALTIPNLTFIEKVPFNQINDYFSKAKLFVNTSTYEGFPNTFVQATMNGTPIISLNVNPDNFLETYKCGYCANGNFKKLQSFTQRLLINKNLWFQMSQNAFQYAKKNHDILKNIITLKQIITNEKLST